MHFCILRKNKFLCRICSVTFLIILDLKQCDQPLFVALTYIICDKSNIVNTFFKELSSYHKNLPHGVIAVREVLA